MFLMLLICGCSGSHKRDWPGSGSFYGNLDSGGECGVPAQNMFYMPAENCEHRVLGYSSATFYADEGTTEEPMGRECLQPLW
jgi:acid phosphatase type 7